MKKCGGHCRSFWQYNKLEFPGTCYKHNKVVRKGNPCIDEINKDIKIIDKTANKMIEKLS
jgi:hypothetical protein